MLTKINDNYIDMDDISFIFFIEDEENYLIGFKSGMEITMSQKEYKSMDEAIQKYHGVFLI